MACLSSMLKIIILHLIAYELACCSAQHMELEYHSEFSSADYLQASQLRGLAYEFIDYYEKLSANSSAVSHVADRVGVDDFKCRNALEQLISALRERNLWAIKLFDAWGNIPPGLFMGNLYDFGNYDECLRIHEQIDSVHMLEGKYCLAKIPVGEMLHLKNLMGSIAFQTGICIPATCNATQLDKMLRSFLKETFKLVVNGTVLEERSCQVAGSEPLSKVAIATIVILSVVLANAVFCTIFDYLFAAKNDLPQFVSACSLRPNSRQLFCVSDYKPHSNVIPCLNGIRCLSLIWIIFAHSFLRQLTSPNINILDVMDWVQTPFAMLLTQGFFSVDTFFFLSALLLVLLAFRELERNSGNLNVPLMYLLRYLRLTPILGIGILVFLSLKYLGDGPIWASIGWEEFASCTKTWWTTLLYVQNYASPTDMCLGHSWYLAVDMQLYLISPIFLLALWKWHTKAIAGMIVVMLLMWACLFSAIMIYDYSMFYKNYMNLGESMIHIYSKTHMRTSPWLIGLIFGYYLHRTKGQQIVLSKLHVLLGWLISLSLLFGVVFCLLPKSQATAAPLTTLEEALFVSLSRIAWPLGLCWLVFACIHGYAGPIDSLLSSPLWQPMTKLSYCMYIFHFLCMNLQAGSVRTNTYFSSYDLMLRFWPGYGYAIMVSVVMYLLIEAPIANLLAYYVRKRPQHVRLTQSTEQILTADSVSAATGVGEEEEEVEEIPETHAD